MYVETDPGLMTKGPPVGRVLCMGGSDQMTPSPRPPLLLRVTRRRLQAIDVGLALLMVLTTAHYAFNFGQDNRSPQVFVLAAIGGLSIVIRRRAPMTSLVAMTISVALATAFGESWAIDPLVAIPIYQVASVYERRRSLPAFVVSSTALAIASASAAVAHRPGGGYFVLIVGVAAWFVGDSVRVRRTYIAGLAEQAAQRQREVVERAQRSVAEERLQIARELHDVVAHSLSVIAVQSGVGRHVIDNQPQEAKKALAAVEATSRSALDELRRMLGVLRRDDSHPASLVPAPGVSGLEPLVDQVRAAGFDVNLDVQGATLASLSPAAELSIYRIVQEALTNVVKHAGPATVRVAIRDEADALVLEVNDDGRGMPNGTGQLSGQGQETHHGIVGMRERVALFGGSFSAERRPEGGFRVLARFPYEGLLPS
jgi:signal transduction histidine kinase